MALVADIQAGVVVTAGIGGDRGNFCPRTTIVGAFDLVAGLAGSIFVPRDDHGCALPALAGNIRRFGQGGLCRALSAVGDEEKYHQHRDDQDGYRFDSHIFYPFGKERRQRESPPLGLFRYSLSYINLTGMSREVANTCIFSQ
jgi:hypothetical protein